MRDKNRGNEFKGCLVWPIYGEREFVPAEVFSEIIMVEFESEKFPAPIGYDVYLRSLYGDYKKDPPVNKQVSHHKYTAYRIK
jgi:lipopolysaccharide cholinephosphotransferase